MIWKIPWIMEGSFQSRPKYLEYLKGMNIWKGLSEPSKHYG